MAARNIILFIGAWLSILRTTGAYTATDASNLEAALLSSYYNAHRPQDQTMITVDMGLYSLNGLDNVEQKLSMIGYLLIAWTDPRLTWTPSSYGNIEQVYLTDSKIWVPPITLANPTDGIKILSDDSNIGSIPIYVTYGGDVTWIAPANLDVQCSVDITYYPFDSQVCSVILTSWMYTISALGIEHNFDQVNLDLFEENGEWELAKTSVFTGSRTLLGHPTAKIEFTMYFNRKYSYYILNMILPVVFTAFLGVLSFYVPTDAGDMPCFSLTVLLSLAVLMTSVSDSIPPTSNHICILSVYMLCTLAISSIEIMFVLILQKLNLCHGNGYELSSVAQAVTHIFAKVTFYKPESNEANNDQTDTGEKQKNGVMHLDEVKVSKVSTTSRPGSKVAHLEKPQIWDTGVKEEKEEIKYTYKDLSAIMNNFCFYFFLVLTIVVTMVFMVVLSTGNKGY